MKYKIILNAIDFSAGTVETKEMAQAGPLVSFLRIVMLIVLVVFC